MTTKNYNELTHNEQLILGKWFLDNRVIINQLWSCEVDGGITPNNIQEKGKFVFQLWKNSVV